MGWAKTFAGKGDVAAYQHFLLSPQCFFYSKGFFFTVVKSRSCVVKSKVDFVKKLVSETDVVDRRSDCTFCAVWS